MLAYKVVRLLAPSYAAPLLIQHGGEAPFFISPNVQAESQCGLCNRTFSPLVYAIGQTTVSQHFHRSVRVGGIYLHSEVPKLTDWLLAGEPSGAWYTVPDDLLAAEQFTAAAISSTAGPRGTLLEDALGCLLPRSDRFRAFEIDWPSMHQIGSYRIHADGSLALHLTVETLERWAHSVNLTPSNHTVPLGLAPPPLES